MLVRCQTQRESLGSDTADVMCKRKRCLSLMFLCPAKGCTHHSLFFQGTGLKNTISCRHPFHFNVEVEMVKLSYFLFLNKMHLRVTGLMELSVINSAFSCHWLLPFCGICGVTVSKPSSRARSSSCAAAVVLLWVRYKVKMKRMLLTPGSHLQEP